MNKKEFIEREDVKELIEEIAGMHAVKVINLLASKTILDEFKISSSLKLEVNFVRSLLYKLYEKKIVSFSKERDSKKGWWIYSWTLHIKKIIELLIKRKKERISRLEEIKSRESSNQYFICESCGIKMDFGEAVENNFECFSCGMPLVALEKKADERELNALIGKLYDEVKELEDFKKRREEREIAKKKKELEKLVGSKRVKKKKKEKTKKERKLKKSVKSKEGKKKKEKMKKGKTRKTAGKVKKTREKGKKEKVKAEKKEGKKKGGKKSIKSKGEKKKGTNKKKGGKKSVKSKGGEKKKGEKSVKSKGKKREKIKEEKKGKKKGSLISRIKKIL